MTRAEDKRNREAYRDFLIPGEAGRFQCETGSELTMKDAFPVCPYTWDRDKERNAKKKGTDSV